MKKKTVPDQVNNLMYGPTYVGPPITFDVEWADSEYTVTIRPWEKQEISKRKSVASNIPLIVVQVSDPYDTYPAEGFALTKSTLSRFFVAGRRKDDDGYLIDHKWLPHAVAHLWVCKTLPGHPGAEKARLSVQGDRLYESEVLPCLKENLPAFGANGHWWCTTNVKELHINRLSGNRRQARRPAPRKKRRIA